MGERKTASKVSWIDRYDFDQTLIALHSPSLRRVLFKVFKKEFIGSLVLLFLYGTLIKAVHVRMLTPLFVRLPVIY